MAKKPTKKTTEKKSQKEALPKCIAFCSAKAEGKEVAENVCVVIYDFSTSKGDESGTCGGRGCCIGCDDIDKGCESPCSYAINRGETDKKVETALTAHDAELLSREVNTSLLEGDIPYNKETYVLRIKLSFKRTVEEMLFAGKWLLVMKEREGHGNFIGIVEDEIGVPYKTAQRCMNAALKAGKFPGIEFAKMDKLSNLYTLLEAPDEDLAELEEKGILAGRTIDELDGMSVKNLKDEIRRLKGDINKVVKEEVKGLAAERKALLNEVKRLSVNDPEGKDLDWSEKQAEEIRAATQAYTDAIRRFVFDERILDHPELQVKVEGILAEAKASLRLLDENWENFVTED